MNKSEKALQKLLWVQFHYLIKNESFFEISADPATRPPEAPGWDINFGELAYKRFEYPNPFPKGKKKYFYRGMPKYHGLRGFRYWAFGEFKFEKYNKGRPPANRLYHYELLNLIKMDVIGLVLKPFLLRGLPEVFEDFEKHQCNFAIVNIQTGRIVFGDKGATEAKLDKEFDILSGIENERGPAGIEVDSDMAKKFVKGITIELFAEKCVVTIQMEYRGLDDIELVYDNREIWKRMKPQS